MKKITIKQFGLQVYIFRHINPLPCRAQAQISFTVDLQSIKSSFSLNPHIFQFMEKRSAHDTYSEVYDMKDSFAFSEDRYWVFYFFEFGPGFHQ